jgi:uncharacterized protein YegL
VDTVVIGLVVDRSYSIATYGLTQPIIDGFNEYIDSQRDEPGETLVSVTFFDTVFEARHVGVPISKVKSLTTETYVPDGNTALYDAIGHTIKQVNKLVRKLGRDDVKVLIVTLTDGEENSSTQYDAASLAALVEEYESLGNWTFVYLGFGQSREYVGSVAVAGIGYVGESGYYPAATRAAVNDSFASLSTGTSSLRRSKLKASANFMADAGIDPSTINSDGGALGDPDDGPGAGEVDENTAESPYTTSSLIDHLKGGK